MKLLGIIYLENQIISTRYLYKPRERPVFRVKSELTGYAVDKCYGMMESWNIGIMGSEGWGLFSMDSACRRLKLRYFPFYAPNIPLFQHSTIPLEAQR
jgi:hypothetical protein